MLFKMIGLSIKMYFKDAANIFDFIVVVVSVFDIIFMVMNSTLSKNGIKAL